MSHTTHGESVSGLRPGTAEGLDAAFFTTSRPSPEDRSIRPDDLVAMLQLIRDNQHLFSELATTISRIRRALDYVRSPEANPTLGCLLVERLRARRVRLMERLQANQRAASLLMGVPDSRSLSLGFSQNIES